MQALWTQLLDLTARGKYTSANFAKALVDGKPSNPLVEAVHGLRGIDKTTYSQVLDTMGVPSGPGVRLPVFGKVSARDALGLALDIGLDPTTYTGAVMELIHSALL